MSRVGKSPIKIPNSVKVGVIGQLVTVRGNLGELTAVIADNIKIDQTEDLITLKTRNNSVTAKKMWGTTRSIVNNLILGVSDGFTKNLEISGVGYRAQIEGEKLQLSLGFSHNVNYQIPHDINISCSDQTHISISFPFENIGNLLDFTDVIVGVIDIEIR